MSSSISPVSPHGGYTDELSRARVDERFIPPLLYAGVRQVIAFTECSEYCSAGPGRRGTPPARKGERRPVYVTAEPWPGIPIRKGNKKQKAADMAAATWPNLTGKFKPHDDRHSHATWLDAADLHKVLQTDRRGHAMPGMDAIYTHVTLEMRQRLCDTLEELWQQAVAQRYELATSSAVPLLNQTLAAYRARRTR